MQIWAFNSKLSVGLECIVKYCEPGKIETARGKESSCIACPVKTVRSWSARARPRWRHQSFLKGPATNSVGDQLWRCSTDAINIWNRFWSIALSFSPGRSEPCLKEGQGPSCPSDHRVVFRWAAAHGTFICDARRTRQGNQVFLDPKITWNNQQYVFTFTYQHLQSQPAPKVSSTLLHTCIW